MYNSQTVYLEHVNSWRGLKKEGEGDRDTKFRRCFMPLLVANSQRTKTNYLL